jgi:hypothetical protein
MNAQKKLTDKILINDHRYVSDSKALIPIVVIESNFDNTSNKNLEIIISENQISQNTSQSIQNKIYSIISDFQWKNSTELDIDILSEFSKLNESSGTSQRIKDLTLNLFKSNNFETL